MFSTVSGSSSQAQDRRAEQPQTKKARVISGFPGVGKSHFARNNSCGMKVLDSDSTQFSKLADKKSPNPAWPENYIDHIRSEMDRADVIFVSTHKDTRALLAENNIAYTLVYPFGNLKREYMDRYKNRGTPEFLLDILDNNWDSFVKDCEMQQGCEHVKLGAGQYIADIAIKLARPSTQKAQVPVNIRVGSGLDAHELDYSRPFASEEELARYVVEKTPVYGMHESLCKRRDLEALERGEFTRILSSRGVRYDLA